MLASAQTLVDDFRQKLGKIEMLPRGILISEFFFLYATLGNNPPQRIIESGRALGQSTELLARFFPETQIISIELEAGHPDADKALARLKPYDNVTCLFGDARQLMLEHTQPQDICIIDGPKDFRALQLAFRTLQAHKPAACFVHDCYPTSVIRPFLNRYYPAAFFSDHAAFTEGYWKLNENFETKIALEDAGVLACLPNAEDIVWGCLNARRTWGRCKANIARSIRKRMGSTQS